MSTELPLTRRQKLFLHRLTTLGPAAFSPDHRPSPAILDRWLRNDSFRAAISELLEASILLAEHRATGTLVANLATLRDPASLSTDTLLRTLEATLLHHRAENPLDDTCCLPTLPPR